MPFSPTFRSNFWDLTDICSGEYRHWHYYPKGNDFDFRISVGFSHWLVKKIGFLDYSSPSNQAYYKPIMTNLFIIGYLDGKCMPAKDFL